MTSTSTVLAVRKVAVTHKDLTIAYMLEGISGIGALLANHTNPVAILEKTISVLEEKGQDTTDLENLKDQFADAHSPGVRGRKSAVVGESRNFTVQQIKNQKTNEMGEVFLHLPCGTLGGAKGSKILASFEDGKIVLTRGPAVAVVVSDA